MSMHLCVHKYMCTQIYKCTQMQVVDRSVLRARGVPFPDLSEAPSLATIIEMSV